MTRLRRWHHAGMETTPGRVLVSANIAATVLFAITAAVAAIVFSTPAQWVGAVTALVLFAVGVFAFLWSYWSAVQRSRTDQIAVSQLYLLLGAAVPRRVRRTMNLVLVAQVVIATVTALGRPNGPDGNPGSSLAVGFLVPMLGFGLNGLWAVTHGDFEPRRHPGTPADEPADGDADSHADELIEAAVDGHADGGADRPADGDADGASHRDADGPVDAGADQEIGTSVPRSGGAIGQNADHG